MNLYFYHSFPRRGGQRVGLKILKSILQKGILLTPELRRLKGCEGFRPKSFVQRRACFTVIPRARLKGHTKKFGKFSLEFEGANLRKFGALPAVYLAGLLPQGQILDNAGSELARHMLAVHDCLRRLWQMHDNGSQQEKRLAVAVLKKIKPEKKTVQELFFTMQALLNLYYPTDDARWTKPLGYYKQREWKITPNFVHKRVWHYRGLTRVEKNELLKVNPRAFGKRLLGKRFVARCHFFADVGGHNIVASVRQIIVPRASLVRARRIVAQSKYPTLRVVGV